MTLGRSFKEGRGMCWEEKRFSRNGRGVRRAARVNVAKIQYMHIEIVIE